MTKRFTYTYGTNKEKSLVIMDHLKRQGLCDGEIADLLNELNDENEQLKHDASVLIQSNKDYRIENEKLKQQNDYLKSLKWNQDCINEISIGMQQRQSLERQNNKLTKENEQLKKKCEYMEDVLNNQGYELVFNGERWVIE